MHLAKTYPDHRRGLITEEGRSFVSCIKHGEFRFGGIFLASLLVSLVTFRYYHVALYDLSGVKKK